MLYDYLGNCEYPMVRKILEDKNFCQCGCGKEIKHNRKFRLGHNKKFAVGPLNPTWKGGKKTDHYGYIWVHRPDHPFTSCDKRIREHRIVWEEYNKAILLPWAVIHHINGIKSDNRIENLQALPSQAEHRRTHKKS